MDLGESPRYFALKAAVSEIRSRLRDVSTHMSRCTRTTGALVCKRLMLSPPVNSGRMRATRNAYIAPTRTVDPQKFSRVDMTFLRQRDMRPNTGNVASPVEPPEIPPDRAAYRRSHRIVQPEGSRPPPNPEECAPRICSPRRRLSSAAVTCCTDGKESPPVVESRFAAWSSCETPGGAGRGPESLLFRAATFLRGGRLPVFPGDSREKCAPPVTGCRRRAITRLDETPRRRGWSGSPPLRRL